MKWLYKGETFNPENVNELYGFIYKLTYERDDETFTYYGKKNFFVTKEQDVLLNGKKRDGHITFVNRNRDGKRVKREVTGTESKWRGYTGSFDKRKVDDKILTEKEILKIIPFGDNHMINLTYWEVHHLIINECLLDGYNINDNIMHRFFRGKIE